MLMKYGIHAKQCKGLRVPTIPDYIEHAAYKCYVFVKLKELKKGWDRDKIIKEINHTRCALLYWSLS